MDLVTARPTELDRYAALARTTGIIGIAFLVLLFGPIIALASAGEPPLEATAAEAVKYFGNVEATWAQLVMAASTLGMIGSLWFFVAFGFLLRRAEGIRLGVRPSRLYPVRCWPRTGWSAPVGRRPRCTGGGSPPRSPTTRTRSATSASRTYGSPWPVSPSAPAG